LEEKFGQESRFTWEFENGSYNSREIKFGRRFGLSVFSGTFGAFKSVILNGFLSQKDIHVVVKNPVQERRVKLKTNSARLLEPHAKVLMAAALHLLGVVIAKHEWFKPSRISPDEEFAEKISQGVRAAHAHAQQILSADLCRSQRQEVAGDN
jgi:hypothetical protein